MAHDVHLFCIYWAHIQLIYESRGFLVRTHANTHGNSMGLLNGKMQINY